MNLTIAPVLVPLATALLCGLFHAAPRRQRAVSLAGALLLLGCALALLQQVAGGANLTLAAGGWPLPFSIALVADGLGSALVTMSALMLTILLLWQSSGVDAAPESPGLHPLLHGLVAGCCAAFLTADLFNLYVWFEVALICALGLLAQGGSLRQLDATLKYFALNLVGTLVLLAAIALLYGMTGQLNLAALGAAAGRLESPLLLPLLGLLLLALLAKAAAFPFFAWLPASYHTLPVPLLALFSALLSKVGICALLRISAGLVPPGAVTLSALIGWLAVLSMLTGVLGAAYHWDMRRILAFHSVSQVGYMLLAVALDSTAGRAAALFFAIHHSLVKAGLFLAAGLICHHAGHYDLRRIGGLYVRRPVLAILFLLFALALVGIPPFSGFWGKYLIIRECLAREAYLWAAFALLVGGLTLYSMLKIWQEAFWKPHPHPERSAAPAAAPAMAYAGLLLLALVTLTMGLAPGPWVDFVRAAAAGLSGGAP